MASAGDSDPGATADEWHTVGPVVSRVLESLDLQLWVATAEADRLVYSTAGYERLFGRSLDELKADPLSFVRSLDPADRDRVRHAVELGMLSDTTFAVRGPDGAVRHLRTKVVPFRDADGIELVGGVTEDVTEHKITEDRATEVRQRLESVLDATSDGVMGFDFDFNILYVNEVGARTVGRGADELLGKNLFTEFPEGEDGSFNQALKRVMQTREPESVEDYFEPWDRWFETRIFPTAQGVAMIGRDITLRTLGFKRERKHLRLLESANVVATSLEGNRIEYWNSEAERLYGYTAEEAIGSVSRELLHTRFPLSYEEMVKEIRSTGTWDGQLQRRHRDGRLVYLVSHMRLYDEGDPSESLIVEMANDIGPLIEAEREQQRLVAELNRTERLDALGQLAGGIAHDFKNLLTVMINSLESAGDGVEPGSRRAADLAEVRRVADRASALTQQLMLFARGGEAEAVPVEIDALVVELTSLLGRLVGDHIEFHIDVAGDDAAVLADRSRLEQVVMNLVLNARDALPYGGQIRVTTTLREVQADEQLGLEPGDYVGLSVSDDGVGMSAEAVERAFEPLFTTKMVGQGTGFGLSTVMGVVKSYGGTATIQSEPDAGTTVDVWLPRVGVSGG